MKQYKKVIATVAAAAILALPLSGCSFNDVMLYLYGGDSFTKEEGEDYQTYDGENGISVTYDANIWNEPSMSQEDTIGITTGNKLSYTAVLLQVSAASRSASYDQIVALLQNVYPTGHTPETAE